MLPGTGPVEGLQLVQLPALEQVAALVHRGSMDDCLASYENLLRWISEHGLRTAGYSREIYIDCPEDVSQWVTELQYVVTAQ